MFTMAFLVDSKFAIIGKEWLRQLLDCSSTQQYIWGVLMCVEGYPYGNMHMTETLYIESLRKDKHGKFPCMLSWETCFVFIINISGEFCKVSDMFTPSKWIGKPIFFYSSWSRKLQKPALSSKERFDVVLTHTSQ